MTSNPLLTPSTLPYSVPDWAAIKPEHILPAVKELMARERQIWEEVGSNTEPATAENTVHILEDAGRDLAAALMPAFTLMSSVGGTEIDAVQAEIYPLLAEHRNAYRLDRRIYNRFTAIDLDALDPETWRYVEEELKEFKRSGIELGDADKARLRELDAKLSALEVEFSQRVVKAMDDHAVVFENVEDLAGLSAERIEAAKQEDGTYRFPLENFTNQTLQMDLDLPQSRKKVLDASLSRGLGEHATSDTREIVLEIARLRAERAELLGYPFHAQAVAEAGMAKDSQAIVDLLGSVAPRAVAAVEQDRVKLEGLAAGSGVKAADYTYYQEKLRAQLGLDDNALRPYLKLENVVEKGIFFAAEKLFGISFKPREDIAGYVPTMKTWEVLDENGEGIGLFQGDYYRRPGKRGGAWMNDAVTGSLRDGTKPVILNNCNFAEPADGGASLLTWDHVITVFHEFGHALHGLLTTTYYRSLAGTSVPRDFVELPSQLFEMWAYHPEVLANFAVHHETGEPLPSELVQKLTEASSFGQAFATTEFLAAALLDQAWHRLDSDEIPDDVEEFEAKALEKFQIGHELVPPRYRSAYFAHTFGGGYDAGYYSYMWAEMLVGDLEDWFRTEGAKDGDGGLNREAGEVYRRELLARGNARDPMESFVAMRGRQPRAEALLERRGLA
ncbi:peptidyl-dipeptidase Dcp [Trueperella bonasi]|uniref:Peptidyl-dipeptidase Dcp n=1 Tax=Trueperella bonasi TaxID=312286 RepID=A0ABT9NE89_9ACTO|nr:M3 family metallopeptidase [Trueperella bonasi]MDP9805697.1 peptidyl-dipeptidase Dcp [Trueperella bonasi]